MTSTDAFAEAPGSHIAAAPSPPAALLSVLTDEFAPLCEERHFSSGLASLSIIILSFFCVYITSSFLFTAE